MKSLKPSCRISSFEMLSVLLFSAFTLGSVSLVQNDRRQGPSTRERLAAATSTAPSSVSLAFDWLQPGASIAQKPSTDKVSFRRG